MAISRSTHLSFFRSISRRIGNRPCAAARCQNSTNVRNWVHPNERVGSQIDGPPLRVAAALKFVLASLALPVFIVSFLCTGGRDFVNGAFPIAGGGQVC